MEKKGNGIIKALLITSGIVASLAGAIAILYTVVKKHFKFTIELCPEEVCDCEGEECICGCENDTEDLEEEEQISVCPEGCECDNDKHCKAVSEEQ